MKLLLDENIPVQLKHDILDFKTINTVFTVAEQDWKGEKNGALLKLMIANDFDALITADKNMQYQQNFKVYKLPVIVLHTVRITYNHFSVLMPQLEKLLSKKLPPGITIIEY